jgi:uncharacterized membrane protein YsdA (DUF1294 family)
MKWYWGIAGGFLLVLVGLMLGKKLTSTVLAIYLAASLLAYLVYAYDKSAARRQQWRIPERNLHLIALLGGWPGALLAQQRLRHKSKKGEFLLVFWATVALNCGLLWWWVR